MTFETASKAQHSWVTVCLFGTREASWYSQCIDHCALESNAAMTFWALVRARIILLPTYVGSGPATLSNLDNAASSRMCANRTQPNVAGNSPCFHVLSFFVVHEHGISNEVEPDAMGLRQRRSSI